MRSINSFLLLASLILVLPSCQKDDEPEPTAPSGSGTTTPSTPSTTPNFPGSDGSLWAVKSITLQTVPFIGTIEVEIGTGVAVFTNDDYTTFLPAGGVSLNGEALTQNSNNAYTFTPSQTAPSGIDFSSDDVDWNVNGAADVPAFTQSVNMIDFPDVDTVSSATTVDRAAGYTLTTPSVTGADSVLFVVGGATKTLGGNATSCTFSASELSGLSAGPSIVMIVGYSFTDQLISGKTYYFGKEMVQSRTVTIQ